MSLIDREELLRRLKLHGRRKDGKMVTPEWLQVAIKEVEHMPEASDRVTVELPPKATQQLPYRDLAPCIVQFYKGYRDTLDGWTATCDWGVISAVVTVSSTGYEGGDSSCTTVQIDFDSQADTCRPEYASGTYGANVASKGPRGGPTLVLWGIGDLELGATKDIFKTVSLLLERTAPEKRQPNAEIF